MFRRKVYGASKVDKCPFCSKQATVRNKQGLPVCSAHKDTSLEGVKCVCGEVLDLRVGKWGPYFNCINCGNITYRKAMEINSHAKFKVQKKNSKEVTVVRSDELDLMY